MAEKTNPTATTTTAAPKEAAKKSHTAEEWAKLTLEQKQKAQRAGDNLTPEQLENIEAEADAEEHRQALREQATKRIPRVVAGIRSVGGLSIHNPNKAQQEAMLKTLKDAVQEVEDKFAGKGKDFTLPD